LQRYVDALDRDDGEVDGLWRGHDIVKTHDNPAWVGLQTDMITKMIEEERYGADAVPDILLTNYKATDLAGHHYTMDSPEMADVLRAQDAALGELVSYLDSTVGDYVVVVSADHGHTPSPERTGAWPMLRDELEQDIDDHFGVSGEASLIQCCSVAGLFLDEGVMREIGITAMDVARYVNRYTIGQNWPGESLPAGYARRADEPIFSSAFPKSKIGEIMTCAFGGRRPPPGFPA
jgi:hypothetical protein